MFHPCFLHIRMEHDAYPVHPDPGGKVSPMPYSMFKYHFPILGEFWDGLCDRLLFNDKYFGQIPLFLPFPIRYAKLIFFMFFAQKLAACQPQINNLAQRINKNLLKMATNCQCETKSRRPSTF